LQGTTGELRMSTTLDLAFEIDTPEKYRKLCADAQACRQRLIESGRQCVAWNPCITYSCDHCYNGTGHGGFNGAAFPVTVCPQRILAAGDEFSRRWQRVVAGNE
jgi:hypothetical protein